MWSIRSAGTECTHKRDERRPRLPAEGLDEADDVRHIDGGSNRRGSGVGPTSSPRIRPRRGVSGPGCGSRSQAGSVVLPRDPHDPPRIPNLAMWARSGQGIPTRATHFDQTRVALVPARSRLERTPGGLGPCEVSAGADSKRLAPDPHGQAIDADPRLQSKGAHVILGDPQGCRGGATGRQEPGLGCWLRNGLT
jgi:hypothetical protein